MSESTPTDGGHRHGHRRAQLRPRARRHFGALRQRADWVTAWGAAAAARTGKADKAVLAALAGLLTLLCFVLLPGWAPMARADRALPASLVALELPLPPNPALAIDEPEPASVWQVVRVERGETMGDIFRRLGLDARTLHRVLQGISTPDALKRIRPGQVFEFRIDAAGALTGLRLERDARTRIELTIGPDAIDERASSAALEHRIAMASGRITGSLFAAGERAGVSDATIMQLAEVFGFDIDFAQDLRAGDQFALVYEQVYRDGERQRDGAILAASFVNQGRRHVALRHADGDGRVEYFGPDGRSLRRAFLRTPVEFSRISSRFSLARKHPILGRMRAHRGVDYAAPTGTPVRAAGSGRIAFRGWQSGYGNVVVLEHGSRKSTLYGHLSRFAPGLARGSKVGQGQVIGYVGMTGLATGPHLHYEFRIDGTHRDPLTVELPKAEPLAGPALAAFRRSTQPLLAQLGLLQERTELVAAR